MRLFKFIAPCCALALCSSALEIEKGWNLVGLEGLANVEELKTLNSNIKTIYHYAGDDIGYLNSGDVKNYNGMWIYADHKGDLKSNSTNTKAIGADKIELKKGWNLLSLPIYSTITPKIFDAKSVYKYENSSWSAYSKEGATPPTLPGIEKISSGEGFWVYSLSEQEIELSRELSKLAPFASAKEMEDFISSLVLHNRSFRSDDNHFGIMPILGEPIAESDMAAPTSGSSSPQKVDDATGTNLQESDVDESDIIKHDGEHIFYLSQKYDDNKIYITSFDKVLSKDGAPLTSIELKSKPSELYLVDNKLVAITPYNNSFWDSWGAINYSLWSENSKVEIYDVSDVLNISKVEEYEIDGNIVDSRVVDGELFVVSRFMPYMKVEYNKVYVNDCNSSTPVYDTPQYDKPQLVDSTSSTASSSDVDTKMAIIAPDYDSNFCYYYQKDENGYFKLDYDNPELKEKFLSPKIKDSKGSSELLSFDKTYAPNRVDQSPFITTILKIDLSTQNRDSISYIGNSSTMYASSSSIYLLSEEYPLYYSFRDYKSRSAIYKFGIGESLSFDGSGFVDGRVLNQFSLSESGDILRVATTEGWSWRGDTDNMLFTLKAVDGELKEQGSLRGLGKEGEIIRGVRFLGNRGFIVTFLQTDPLYTIDLSDPTNILKVGELEISGYSSYFHPVSENLIMSVGKEADEKGSEIGVMLQLFDISDFSKPTQVDKVVIGDSSYSSEAVNNHKAFSYRASDALFSLPIGYYNKEYKYTNYLSLYKIENDKFTKSIDVNSSSSSYIYSGQRGVIFSKDLKDYAIYFDGENLNLGEID